MHSASYGHIKFDESGRLDEKDDDKAHGQQKAAKWRLVNRQFLAIASGHGGFSIWLSASDLPDNFAFPAGNYSAYRLNANETGGSFTYETGKAIVTPTNFTRLKAPN